jgi:hypothetical protein
MYLDNFPQIAEYISEGEDEAARKLYNEALEKSQQLGYDNGLSDITAMDSLIEEWIIEHQSFDEAVEKRAEEMGMGYPEPEAEHTYINKELVQSIHLVAHGDTGPYGWEFCARCK